MPEASNVNSDDGKFDNYFHDLNEVIKDSLEGVIDWTVTAAQEMAASKLSEHTLTTLKTMCRFDKYKYTPECESLVNRLCNEDMPVMGWRNELLRDHEFKDKQFDPVKHQDWAFVKFITDHFERCMEFENNLLMLPLYERTAVSYAVQPILNHLFLPYAHLFSIKWIEVNNDFTETTKIDGMGFIKDKRELLLIIEFSGGNVSRSTAKYNSDIKKMYNNALKAIKQSKRNKIFTILYFNN